MWQNVNMQSWILPSGTRSDGIIKIRSWQHYWGSKQTITLFTLISFSSLQRSIALSTMERDRGCGSLQTNTHGSRWRSATPDTARTGTRWCTRWSPRSAWCCCTTCTPCRCWCSWSRKSSGSTAFCISLHFDWDWLKQSTNTIILFVKCTAAQLNGLHVFCRLGDIFKWAKCGIKIKAQMAWWY